jgi:hypothetical protein
VRIALVRADSGFCTHGMIAELEAHELQYILSHCSNRTTGK